MRLIKISFKLLLSFLLLTSLFALSHVFASGVFYAEDYIFSQYAYAKYVTTDYLATTAGYEKPKQPQEKLNIWQIARREAIKNHLNPGLVYSVIEQETGTKNNAFKISSAGALGVMQIMPANAIKFCKWTSSQQAFDEEENIICGTRLLKHEIDDAAGSVVIGLRRYNASTDCKNGGCPEVEKYVREVLDRWARDIHGLS